MNQQCSDFRADKHGIEGLTVWSAASEIERLRDVLRFYACECSGDEACETFGDHDRSACGYKARAALGEDK